MTFLICIFSLPWNLRLTENPDTPYSAARFGLPLFDSAFFFFPLFPISLDSLFPGMHAYTCTYTTLARYSLFEYEYI